MEVFSHQIELDLKVEVRNSFKEEIGVWSVHVMLPI